MNTRISSVNAAAEQAIVYVRVSTSRQLQGASLETQERACRRFCEERGWQVLRVFREEGESAKTANRTQLREMLVFCRRNRPRPTFVVVYALDRFARNGMDHDALRAALLSMQVKLRCVQTPLGESPYDKAMERMLSAIPQLENEIRAQSSVAGMKTRLAEGNWTFKAPLGYVNARNAQNRKTLVHDSERAPLIREAFETYATGLYTKFQVRQKVNAIGLRTHVGKPIGPETFNRMLKNPLYAGILSVADWSIDTQARFAPIVTMEVFGRVQELLAGRCKTVTPRQRNREEFPLRGFVRCGFCNAPLTGVPRQAR